MSNSDAVITAARALIDECLQRQALQDAMRQRAVRGGTDLAAIAVTAIPDPSRVARGDTVRVDQFDGENWREIWRSAAPAASPSPAPEAIPEPPPSHFGTTQPGQVIVVDGRFAIAK
jgi:hypothetical protein